jgi:sulfur-oxidizing protein SoxX
VNKTLLSLVVFASSLSALEVAPAIERPLASHIIENDLTPKARHYTMPKKCVSDNRESINRGAYIFHNLNSEKAQGDIPKKILLQLRDGKIKQYGNCVACHNIEGAIGHGNIGPDLTHYNEYFIQSGVRDAAYVYQKIADPRTDNPNTHMTINLTNKLMSEEEICDLTSYILAKKSHN